MTRSTGAVEKPNSWAPSSADAEEVRELMAELGYRTFDGMIGQMQMLDRRQVA